MVSDLEAAIEYYALGEFNNWLVRGWVGGRRVRAGGWVTERLGGTEF